MKFKQLSWVAVGLLTAAATLSAKPIVVNDGKKLTNLVGIENTLNEGGAEIDLTVVMRNGRWPIGYLEMAQAGKYTNPALCAAWHSDRYQPGTGVYTVSAEVMLVGAEDVWLVGFRVRRRHLFCVESLRRFSGGHGFLFG